jgi:RHS repeat-associated protein
VNRILLILFVHRKVHRGNRLVGVTDGINNQNSVLGDFHYNPNGKGAVDYTYDQNGNMTTDFNKGINPITYNYLNLPQQVHMAGKGNIIYTYNAGGNKLAKVTMDSLSRHATTTVYIGGFVYQQGDTITNPAAGIDTLQFMAHEEGRARWAFHRYASGTTGYKWEYDFFEKDHLGNTREVLTQQRDTAKYMATLEAAYRATENALFYNIGSTNVWSYYVNAAAGPNPFGTAVTNPNDSVSQINGNTPKEGPAIILKVMAGDTYKVAVLSFWKSGQTSTGTTDAITDILSSLANGIVSTAGGAKGSYATLSNTTTCPLLGGVNSFRSANNPTPPTNPKAYLNYVVLDNQFNYDATSSGARPVGAADVLLPLTDSIRIKKNGYLYIYLSNETKGVSVFFDNLSVTHYSGPLLEETHYYPFGLTMVGISDKALKRYYAENRYRYNGKELQNKEFADGTGLDGYDYGKRLQDPQIGRWWSLDTKTELLEISSPYVFCYNNPISYTDPDGELAILINGRVSSGDAQRPVNGNPGKMLYWDAGVIDAIKNSGLPNSADMFYVDGDRWGKYTWGDDPSKVHFEMHNGTYFSGNEPENRKLAGENAAASDWNAIISRLKKDPNSKKIIEKIEVYTHSRGAAFGAGYVSELLRLIEKNADLFADSKNEIDLILNMAPHESWGIDEPEGLNAYSISHAMDPLSGQLMSNLKGAFSTIENSPGFLGSHSTASFVKDVTSFFKAFSASNGDNKKIINDFVKEMSKYNIKVNVIE